LFVGRRCLCDFEARREEGKAPRAAQTERPRALLFVDDEPIDLLLETAKLCGVDPARYLREAALADARGEVLLPDPSRTDRAYAQDGELVKTGEGET
jgi:hypothetical protein